MNKTKTINLSDAINYSKKGILEALLDKDSHYFDTFSGEKKPTKTITNDRLLRLATYEPIMEYEQSRGKSFIVRIPTDKNGNTISGDKLIKWLSQPTSINIKGKLSYWITHIIHSGLVADLEKRLGVAFPVKENAKKQATSNIDLIRDIVNSYKPIA